MHSEPVNWLQASPDRLALLCKREAQERAPEKEVDS